MATFTHGLRHGLGSAAAAAAVKPLFGSGPPGDIFLRKNIFDFFLFWHLFVAQGVWNNWIVVQQ
jgi:hypothetical protein